MTTGAAGDRTATRVFGRVGDPRLNSETRKSAGDLPAARASHPSRCGEVAGVLGVGGLFPARKMAVLKHGALVSHCAGRESTGQSPSRREAEESPGSNGQGAR